MLQVLEFTNKFDRLNAQAMSALQIGTQELQAALASLPSERRQALEAAAARVRALITKYKNVNVVQLVLAYRSRWYGFGTESDAARSRWYLCPGGKAAYPSVLMNAIPAKVAGVQEIIAVVPTPDGA